MIRFAFAIVIFLAVILTNCTSSLSGTDDITTPSVSTEVVTTASISTVEPVIITAEPPNYTPLPTQPLPTQTPIPTIQGGLSPTELKYRVLAEFPDFFFCDPDFYPVGRDDEAVLALQRFPEIQTNSEEFEAILEHNNLAINSTFSDAEKLLIYREHKELAALQFEQSKDTYQFQITVAKTEGEGELIRGQIDGQGRIEVLQRTAAIATCPICLAAGTLIDTPQGPVPVRDLRTGMLVWTMDAAGKRIAQPLIQVGKTSVPTSHQVVRILLDDGRELWVSPGHPTSDGRTVGELRAGDVLDGGIILTAQPVSYRGSATYDLLPSGETGLYWANDILLASTLDQ